MRFCIHIKHTLPATTPAVTHHAHTFIKDGLPKITCFRVQGHEIVEEGRPTPLHIGAEWGWGWGWGAGGGLGILVGGERPRG